MAASFLLLLWTGSALTLLAQESASSATGTIQGTVRDTDGTPVEAARVRFFSRATETNVVTRSNKDGSFVSEPLPVGPYVVQVTAQDFQIAEANVNVQSGAVATADFTLEPINPGPAGLESKVTGRAVTTEALPATNGRHYLNAARTVPGVQVADGTILDPGKTGYQSLAINSRFGRTVHYDLDEVESMDETKGTFTQGLPAQAVSEVTATRATPSVFQSLNALGSVRVRSRSGGDEWHGVAYEHYRDRRMGVTGFPSGSPDYNRHLFGFGAGGPLIKDKAFLFVAGERTNQDGMLPLLVAYPAFPGTSLRDAYLRANQFSLRADYNYSENRKLFLRWSYDNANGIGVNTGPSGFRNQFNVPGGVVGMDWNRGKFAHSGRFGYQKLVDAITPAGDFINPQAPFHQQIGSFEYDPTILGPRQTIQSDLFGRYDGSVPLNDRHTARFGAAINHISQVDFYTPGIGTLGPSVTSSNGINVINAIFNDPNPPFPPMFPGDPRGAAGNTLNYPVGTVTIFNGLGNFSEHSEFGKSNGGHSDNRIEAYGADTIHFLPNLNINVGVNYVRDTGRTNSDIGMIPCSAINQTFVKNPPCMGDRPLLEQYGNVQGIGAAVSQPNFNFSPQLGVAWDPGHNGKTVVRAGGGLFFDNFLFQNSYQDRMSRLSNGQYFRSLTVCPTGTVLFPDGSQVSSVMVNGQAVDIATGICGQAIGLATPAIEQLQADFLAAQAAVTSGPNIYSLTNSLANFGGMLAPSYETPRVSHLNVGVEHALGDHTWFSVDYTHQIGSKFPLGIDTNHVGDASHIDTNAALAAIGATVTAADCAAPGAVGSQSFAAINCYLNALPNASIVDFARNGLDSSNAYCGPFPCAVLKPAPIGNQQPNAAAFSGINSAVGSNVMYLPSGHSKYDAIQATLRTSGARLGPAVRRWELLASWTYSKYQTNVAQANGGGGDYSLLSVAEDYNSPHTNHFGYSGLDRRHSITVVPTVDFPRGPRLAMYMQFSSPLELSARLPQADGGGVAGEIFRSDYTGDGTVGDLLPKTGIGGLGGYSGNDLSKAVAYYNTTYAGKLTPAGQQLITSKLFTADQLLRLGAYMPLLQPVPGHAAEATWLKTIDMRLSWPFRVGERVSIEPSAAAFNVFNFANFGGPGRQLNGILDGSPGSALNNASSPGFCGGASNYCTSRLDRVQAGSGTYWTGAPRQLEFAVRVTF